MKQLLIHLASGGVLSEEQTMQAFDLIMKGEAGAASVGAFLALIAARGATEDELVGAAKVMREKMVRVAVPAGMRILDTCGTGGTHSPTFNISTTAGLIAAGACREKKVGIAKHGNRSVTSASGSSQVLEALGVKIGVGEKLLVKCLEEAGFCFCFAPAHHPAMKHVGAIRGELGFRTIFNMVGPLANPAGATRQVMGVFSHEVTGLMAGVLKRLGVTDALVLHTRAEGLAAGLGELLAFGKTTMSYLHGGVIQVREWGPVSKQNDLAAISITTAEESAALVRGVLAGKAGPARETACWNAGAAIWVAGCAESLEEGKVLAEQAIDKGSAKQVLETVSRITQEG